MIGHLSYFFKNPQSFSIGAIFALNSFMFGNWVTQIANVKSALGLSEAALGMALLGAPIGALSLMPFVGYFIERLHLGRSIIIAGVFHTLSLLGLAFADSFWGLALGLLGYGLTNSLMDIAMNASASQVEKSMKKPIMSTCHGMWSLGAVLGSLTGSLAIGQHIHVSTHLVLITVIVLVFILLLARAIWSLKETKTDGQKVFAFPRGMLLVLAIMAFCILLSEGAIADWSAVYMKESLLAEGYLIGLAYDGFSFCMALGRFLGDAIIPKFGKGPTLKWGGAISSFGLFIAIVFPHPYMAILGFAITGFGYSCIVPILFIAAANQPGYTAGSGIAAVTTLGYTGFLIGPPMIGFLADSFGLPFGMGFIMVCSGLVSILAIMLKFK
jgi:MFS family permease